MDEIVEQFAEQQDIEPDTVRERWAGNPGQIAEDIFRIQDVETGQVEDLDLFKPIQTKVIDAYFYSDAKTLNLYKGRRIGYSFVVVLAFLLDGMMNPNSVFPVVGIKQDGAESRISDIQKLIDNAKVEIPTVKDNNGEIELWNGSKFVAYSGAPDSSRGDESAKAVLLDEMAFYEDQEAVSRAFRAFIVLGSNRKMVQVSTPKLSSDLFMQTHRKGTANGENGTLSIKQPTFYNAEAIDPEVSLFEQEIHPVRPDLDIQTVEEERSKDPKGFAQEYLCKPIDDSYAFFNPESIDRAMARNGAVPRRGKTVMGVDIGISSDDTVIAVFRHTNDERYQLDLEVVTDDVLRQAGIKNPDRGNANHVAHRIAQKHSEHGVDTVVMDRTGPGETFDRIVTEKLGRAIRGFNFSDKEAVEDMMGDLNNGLRNDRVQLIQDARLDDELNSIIKERTKESANADFTGKETSETGKDDTAWAVALGAFPPGMAVQSGTKPRSGDDGGTQRGGDMEAERESVGPASATPAQKKPSGGSFGSVRTSRGNREQNYNQRYRR